MTLVASQGTEWDEFASAEVDLVEACQCFAKAQQDSGEHFASIQPAGWDAYAAEVETMHVMLQRITAQPAGTPRGLRAKAVALKSVLHDGNGSELYDDASVPDQLAWSLVQDLLALLPAVTLASARH